MKRIEVVQRIIDRKKARTYLEIGVSNGTNFFRIRVRKKTAVDPHFRFSRPPGAAKSAASDGGLGIVTKGEPESPLQLTEEALDRMTYRDLSGDRKSLLNLKDESYLFEFLETI